MQPPTGFYRDGYCRVGPEDKGNHSVAATVTEEFLDYSASAGNNLKDVGVKPGMKWCLCAHRWLESFEAAEKGLLARESVPKVHLHASHEKALDKIPYKTLKQFAAEGEAPSQGNRQPSHYEPEKPGSIASHANATGGYMGTTAPGGR
jgi:uncharacterized protein